MYTPYYRFILEIRCGRVDWRLRLIICHVLEELNAVRVSEVLPALQIIFLRDNPSRAYGKAIKAFVAARRFSDQPVNCLPFAMGRDLEGLGTWRLIML